MGTCVIIRNGRSDTFGNPLTIGQTFDGTDDYVRDLVSQGFGARPTYTDQRDVILTANGPKTAVILNANGSVVAGAVTGVIVKDSPVAPPLTTCTAAVGSAGALTGAYYYGVAYLLDNGDVTAPWSGTATVVNPAAQRVNLTNIPISPSSQVVGRVLLRTAAGTPDPKAYFVLATIPDNTTTTYTDNAADAALGDPANWTGSASGVLTSGASGITAAGLGGESQAVVLGVGARGGYACTVVGHAAGTSMTTGRRNSLFGIYAGTSLTTGYQNTCMGTHAGQNITTSFSSVFMGYNAGFNVTTAEENTAIGTNALGSQTVNPARRNTSVGMNSMLSISSGWTGCSAFGYAAGKYLDANYQLSIDVGIDRANTAGNKNLSLIFAQGVPASPQTQYLYLNGGVRLGWDTPTVSQLPAASATLRGCRAYVTDASVAYTGANIGSTVAGGGANTVPVFCNGTNWVVG